MVEFNLVSDYFSKIEKESSRLKMTDLLARLFQDCQGSSEIPVISYFVQGSLAPNFIPVEFDLANKSIMNVLELIRKDSDIDKTSSDMFDEMGDLGLVAEEIVKDLYSNNVKGLSISEVYSKLWKIALVSGSGSVDRKSNLLMNLLVSVSPTSAKYIVRIILDQLRLGLSSKTVLDALSVARTGSKGERDDIEKAYGVCSDLGFVASRYLDGGRESLEEIEIEPGIPIFSMLVEREKDVESIFERIPESIVQPKFDGLRCQVHVGTDFERQFEDRVWWNYYKDSEEDSQVDMFELKGGDGKKVFLFSRNLEDMTDMFPDLVSTADNLAADSVVLDGEVIGYNEDTGEYMQFQKTMTRKRKYGVHNAADEVPVKFFVFDVLYLNGESLINKKLSDRLELIPDLICGTDKFEMTQSTEVDSEKKMNDLFEESVSKGLEGLIIKDPDSKYQPGKRSLDWLKYKRSLKGELVDTVDVVIMGYYFGRGRQAEFGIGALLGGVFNKEEQKYETICKIGTGVTDDEWRMIKSDLDELEIGSKSKNYIVNKDMVPDVWIYPEIVAEVEADEVTRSPVHTAGKDEDGVGYALRFPRLKKWDRKKDPEDATSVREVVEELYRF